MGFASYLKGAVLKDLNHHQCYKKKTMFYQIADLHCDLLSYLEHQANRTPHDSNMRCSFPNLKRGHVGWQTLAVFAETGSNSVEYGMRQVQLFRDLPHFYPHEAAHYVQRHDSSSSQLIQLLLAFEGASTFCDELEPLQQGLARLETIILEIAKPLYIGLTWNMENRFGGGSATQIGLKEDGKHLLDFLHQKEIAVDLSHTSDPLAHDILNYLDRKNLAIPILASHSNSRAVANVPRNLPDELAQEIFRRDGLIGLNLYRPFVGLQSPAYLARHLAHWLELGGENHLAFGADFFFESDFHLASRPADGIYFYPEYGDASCYQQLLKFLGSTLGLTTDQLDKLAYQNVLQRVEKYPLRSIQF